MTEEHEDDFLVRVRAQVMTRDESTEGWLPLAGGGLANVSIRKRAKLSSETGGHEYIIYGQRISDQTVILSCVIKRDLEYFIVMPTFHHWRAGKHRNGLTFLSAADARAFDKGIVKAYDDLIDGMTKNNPSTLPLCKYDNQVGEDDVFMTLDLPLEPSDSRSNSEGSGSQKSVGERHQQQTNIHIISCEKPPPPPPPPLLSSQLQQTQQSHHHSSLIDANIVTEQPPSIAPGDNYSYVQLTTVHEYNYPVVDQPVSSGIGSGRRDSMCSLKKRQPDAPSLNIKGSHLSQHPLHQQQLYGRTRMRCKFCHEFYTEEWNRRGACEFAPDCFRNGLEQISGMKCARCMLYHCMSDSEGETPQHPCECVWESGCTKRWIGLALLSLLVPCLWCYPPLRACHLIGVSCGICGGKHKP